MSFKFSLETLLEMRVKKEDEIKQIFSKSKRELELKKLQKQEMEENYEKYSGINPGETLVYQKIKKNYLFALDKGIDNIEKEIDKKKKEVDFQRDQLKKRQIERKTVDILKEKQYNQYITEENRKEQLENDEFALYAFIRNQREEVRK